MTTALDVIKGALRDIMAVEAGEAPTSEESSDALSKLNLMMHGFNAEGIDFVHTTMTLTDTMNVPEEQVLHVRYMLAVLLASEYGKEASPTVMARAETGRRYLQAVYSLPQTAPVDPAIGMRRGVIFNFTTGQ
jgi:hypothetical protein